MRTRVATVMLIVVVALPRAAVAQNTTSGSAARIERLLDEGQWAQAIAALDQQINATPSSALFAQRGRAYRELGDAARSRRDYDAALQLDSTFARAYAGRAATRLQTTDATGVLEDVARARRFGLAVPPLILLEAVAYGQLDNDAAAIAAFDRYVKAAPDDPQGWYYRGYTHGRANRHPEAIADLTRAIALRMSGAAVYRYRALSYLAMQQTAEACSDGAEAAKRGDDEAARLVQQHCGR